MRDYYNNPEVVLEHESDGVNRYVAKVFGWMFFGLLLTAMSTFTIVVAINISETAAALVNSLMPLAFIVFLVQVFMVGALSLRITKMNTSTAVLLYVTYAIVNGFTIGFIALMYAGSGVVSAFLITAVSFGVMAIYGYKTKADLTKAGNLLRMGLIGIIILSVVNIFLGSGMMDFLICIAGLFIFLGLTAYDTKKIKTQYAQVAVSGGDVKLANNLAIIGALMLYLDFINLFMFILRLMGGRR